MYTFKSTTYEMTSWFFMCTVFVLSLPSGSSAMEVCNFNLNSMCYLPGRFVGIVDKQFYEKFVDADGVPVMGSVEVGDPTLMNFAKLIKTMMQHLQPDIRQALIDRKTRVAVLARGDSFCRIPEISYHHYLSPGKPCSQPGAYGVTFKNLIIVTEGDEGCDHRGSLKAGRVLLHEFAHAINFAIDEKPMDYLKKSLDDAYQSALDAGLLNGLKVNIKNSWLHRLNACGVCIQFFWLLRAVSPAFAYSVAPSEFVYSFPASVPPLLAVFYRIQHSHALPWLCIKRSWL